MDYDRILVLEKGEIAEYGTPFDLMEISTVGVFRKMCEDTGEYAELREIAMRVAREKAMREKDLIQL